ncbi:BBP7 family outer membrane beta-barrel protein [Gemmata sp. JC717]|uniref:BBP7 family outer membrane beta-barrel protein n=1 Tax=Gemmata algarum TaxID=2975278 RepID=UPI0021BA4480|nr:BBP7 family outer membrane beta-barrel protein [Gemmata algarum]MDY3552309.1 BBP7 family outer membrane beta-barrel protein [Gemmata algarum]
MRAKLITTAVFLLTASGVRAEPPRLLSAEPAPAWADTGTTPAPATVNIPTETRPFTMAGPQFWASGDYVLAWYTPIRTPPLIQAVPAALANQSTGNGAVTLFPENNRINFGAFSGIRASVGANFDKFGVEVGGFVLERQGESSSFFNNGNPVALGQGYISAGSGLPTTLFASLPGQYSGGVSAAAQSRLWGVDGNIRRAWYTFLFDTTDVLVGFKYLDLHESLTVYSPSVFPGGGVISSRDSVRTSNRFYGGYVGINSRLGNDRGFGLDLTSKSGLGGVAQRAELVGSNSFIPAGGAADIEPAGLYARGLNAGTFTRGKVAYTQDLELKLTYNFNPWFQVSFGYSLMYMSSAIRPGGAIDAVVNDSNVRFVAQPTPSTLARPAFAWRADGLTVNALTFGARLQY